jgi:hypothetical protein
MKVGDKVYHKDPANNYGLGIIRKEINHPQGTYYSVSWRNLDVDGEVWYKEDSLIEAKQECQEKGEVCHYCGYPLPTNDHKEYAVYISTKGKICVVRREPYAEGALEYGGTMSYYDLRDRGAKFLTFGELNNLIWGSEYE